jgi:hypothetical protein
LNTNPNTDPNKGMAVSNTGGFGHPVCDAGNATLDPKTLPSVQDN